MEKRAVFAVLMAVAMVFAVGLATTANAVPEDGAGPHYNLNIAAFANCEMEGPGDYPDCFKGNTGPGGHVIFIPIKTSHTTDLCATNDANSPDAIQTSGDLMKGVRILVKDGPKLEVLDKDATDGTATFQLPAGCYDIYAAPAGKPGGCLDLDTVICCTDTTSVATCKNTQLDCHEALDQGYARVGHIDVDRTTGKPHWVKVDHDLLGVGDWLLHTDSSNDSYFDFFWQIYNNYLRLLKLRIQEVACLT